jgi:hypothetical protein
LVTLHQTGQAVRMLEDHKPPTPAATPNKNVIIIRMFVAVPLTSVVGV